MAISDILCALTIPVQWILCSKQFLNYSNDSEIFCVINKFLQILSFYVSSLTFTAIAIDRFIVIHFPFKRSPLFFIKIIWIICISFVTLTAVSIPVLTYNWSFDANPIITCRVLFKFGNPVIVHVRVLGILLTQYILPVLISLILYAKIIHTIWKRNVGEMTEMQKNHNLIVKWRTIKMLIILFLVFTICWFPVNMIRLVMYYFNPLKSKGCQIMTLYLIFYWLGISSCSYNPFIFWWLNKEFRTGTKTLLSFITFKCINK